MIDSSKFGIGILKKKELKNKLFRNKIQGRMAELVDARRSGRRDRKIMRVRVSPRPPKLYFFNIC